MGVVSLVLFLLFRDEVGAISESESSSESASSALARAILRTRTGSVNRFEGLRYYRFSTRLDRVGLVRGVWYRGCMKFQGDKGGLRLHTRGT